MTKPHSLQVILTAERGEKLSQQSNLKFQSGLASGRAIRVDPKKSKQVIKGIGGSFTESSAYVLAHLEPGKRQEVMERLFSVTDANFSMARTPIGSCDFTVEGCWSYQDIESDLNTSFSVRPDKDGFNRKKYPGIKDEYYDLLPMIKQALSIKSQQPDDADLRIVASAWTAPVWMKSNQSWYGGELAVDHRATYADYLIRYLDAYSREGVPVWAITPVNEPYGNNERWESMHFSAYSQNDFIRDYLGPKLSTSAYKETRLLMYDQNRDQLEHWADVLYNDNDCARYLYGAAIHWYESTVNVSEDILDRVHQKYPMYSIIHTEGCIDDLGNDAPPGIRDPAGYKEHGWFDNDAFWWNECATDWAYTATWAGVNADEHPMYTPVHRYARNILVSLNHWVSGWIDWNLVLDRRGGPNHVGNYCGAPIMIDTESGYVYYTPVYYILAQISRTIRPGDVMVQTDVDNGLNFDKKVYACASMSTDNLLNIQILNTSRQSESSCIQVGDYFSNLHLPTNSLMTVTLSLDGVEKGYQP